MNLLYTHHDQLLASIQGDYKRYAYDTLPWEERMFGIKGPRGAGKTTLLLQYIKYGLKANANEALYISADHYWFYTHLLSEVVDEFYRNGGRYLFIDEIHKYPNWSIELKNIYDHYPNLKTVFTASSALEIQKGEADLSRRALMFELAGLSFREYLNLSLEKTLVSYSLNEILQDHRNLAAELKQALPPILPLFKQYLKIGYLPIFKESNEVLTLLKIQQIINTVIESDLSYIEGYSIHSAHKLKQLLGVIAECVPFKPNISALANKLNASRDSIYEWLQLLSRAKLIHLAQVAGKGVSILQKPEKIYFENSNLDYALKTQPEIGSIRECFFFNQLKNAGHLVELSAKSDFLIDSIYTLEIGGRNKEQKQIQGIQNAWLALDELESGNGNRIPLWLFGFLY
ncbi:MAG: ATP-binding protein [Bacteroidia bacterium]